jgi:hypothetical protein
MDCSATVRMILSYIYLEHRHHAQDLGFINAPQVPQASHSMLRIFNPQTRSLGKLDFLNIMPVLFLFPITFYPHHCGSK